MIFHKLIPCILRNSLDVCLIPKHLGFRNFPFEAEYVKYSVGVNIRLSPEAMIPQYIWVLGSEFFMPSPTFQCLHFTFSCVALGVVSLELLHIDIKFAALLAKFDLSLSLGSIHDQNLRHTIPLIKQGQRFMSIGFLPQWVSPRPTTLSAKYLSRSALLPGLDLGKHGIGK
jgi:hypothetical protein